MTQQALLDAISSIEVLLLHVDLNGPSEKLVTSFNQACPCVGLTRADLKLDRVSFSPFSGNFAAVPGYFINFEHLHWSMMSNPGSFMAWTRDLFFSSCTRRAAMKRVALSTIDRTATFFLPVSSHRTSAWTASPNSVARSRYTGAEVFWRAKC